ncbi:MAG: phytanoyl-CoA dioxygenase family protein, partial [Pikeienuella sp.]
MFNDYNRDGFVYPLQVITPEKAAEWRADLEAMEAEYRTADLPHPMQMYRRSNAHAVIPLAAEIATHPSILDAVQDILGPDLLIWGAEFFI